MNANAFDQQMVSQILEWWREKFRSAGSVIQLSLYVDDTEMGIGLSAGGEIRWIVTVSSGVHVIDKFERASGGRLGEASRFDDVARLLTLALGGSYRANQGWLKGDSPEPASWKSMDYHTMGGSTRYFDEADPSRFIVINSPMDSRILKAMTMDIDSLNLALSKEGGF